MFNRKLIDEINELTEALDDTTSILEKHMSDILKAEAKEPQEKRLLYKNFSIGKCNTCSSAVNTEMNYCSICGQKIKWK